MDTIEWIKFKTPRIGEEWTNLLDIRLRAMLLEHGLWQFREYGEPLWITCIGRTVQENAEVGGRHMSAHLILPGKKVRAVDVRSRNLNPDQQQAWLTRLHDVWNHAPRGLLHAISEPTHFHVNINYPYA